MNLQTLFLEVLPSGRPAGAEIRGVDIANGFDNETFKKIDEAFNTHSVIYFRNQKINEEQLIAFTSRFGGAERNTFTEQHAHPEHSEILLVSNIVVDGKHIGNPDAGHTWHTDQSYTKCPPRATILFAIEVPEKDGKVLGSTLYASAAAAYDALPDDIKKRLEGLKAIHSITARKRGGKATEKITADQQARNPEVEHPIVRTHPFTGRKCLYVREGECIGIVGMPEKEALPLIDELSEHITKPEFIYQHQWQQGDVIIWDNCALQHLATKDYELPQRRFMWRTVVKGSVPF